jgi:hypothetical protein
LLRQLFCVAGKGHARVSDEYCDEEEFEPECSWLGEEMSLAGPGGGKRMFRRGEVPLAAAPVLVLLLLSGEGLFANGSSEEVLELEFELEWVWP